MVTGRSSARPVIKGARVTVAARPVPLMDRPWKVESRQRGGGTTPILPTEDRQVNSCRWCTRPPTASGMCTGHLLQDVLRPPDTERGRVEAERHNKIVAGMVARELAAVEAARKPTCRHEDGCTEPAVGWRGRCLHHDPNGYREAEENRKVLAGARGLCTTPDCDDPSFYPVGTGDPAEARCVACWIAFCRDEFCSEWPEVCCS